MLICFSLDEEGWQWGGRVEARRSRDTIVDKHTHKVLFLAFYQDLGGMFLEGKVWRDGERKRGMEGRKGGGYNGGKSGAVDRG